MVDGTSMGMEPAIQSHDQLDLPDRLAGLAGDLLGRHSRGGQRPDLGVPLAELARRRAHPIRLRRCARSGTAIRVGSFRASRPAGTSRNDCGRRPCFDSRGAERPGGFAWSSGACRPWLCKFDRCETRSRANAGSASGDAARSRFEPSSTCLVASIHKVTATTRHASPATTVTEGHERPQSRGHARILPWLKRPVGLSPGVLSSLSRVQRPVASMGVGLRRRPTAPQPELAAVPYSPRRLRGRRRRPRGAGRPAAAAIRAQSSYSGLKVGGRFSSQPSFPRTGPNGVSTSSACRLSLCRLTG